MGQKYSLIESGSFGHILILTDLIRHPAIIGYGALLRVLYLEDYLGHSFMMHSFTRERITFLRSGLRMALLQIFDFIPFYFKNYWLKATIFHLVFRKWKVEKESLFLWINLEKLGCNNFKN